MPDNYNESSVHSRFDGSSILATSLVALKHDPYISELFFELAKIKQSILTVGLGKVYLPRKEGFVYDVIRTVIRQVRNGDSPECFDIIIDITLHYHFATATQSEIYALIIFKNLYRSILEHPRWPQFTTIVDFFCEREVSDNIARLFQDIPFKDRL